MKSRIVAGIRAKYTRRLHKAQQLLWMKFVDSCKREANFIPTYYEREDGYELCYDRGYGIKTLKFDKKDEIFNFIASLC